MATHPACDGFANAFGGGQFFHHFFVLEQDSWVVHHLSQVVNVWPLEHGFYARGIDYRSGCFKAGSWYTGWGPKVKLQFSVPGIINHVTDALNTQDIGNLVWIRNSSHGTILERHACKLVGHEHRTFNVDVRIHKTGHNVLLWGAFYLLDRSNTLPFDADFARKNTLLMKIDNLATDRSHSYFFRKLNLSLKMSFGLQFQDCNRKLRRYGANALGSTFWMGCCVCGSS